MIFIQPSGCMLCSCTAFHVSAFMQFFYMQMEELHLQFHDIKEPGCCKNPCLCDRLAEGLPYVFSPLSHVNADRLS
jgi:hypothetical protein